MGTLRMESPLKLGTLGRHWSSCRAGKHEPREGGIQGCSLGRLSNLELGEKSRNSHVPFGHHFPLRSYLSLEDKGQVTDACQLLTTESPCSSMCSVIIIEHILPNVSVLCHV